MQTKNIQFSYTGGTEQIELNVKGTSLPVTYIMDNNEWISVEINANIVNITVTPTYDYRSRDCQIKLLNAKGNELIVNVLQSGYDGIGIRCDKSIVLSHSYFDMSDFYGFYVTIYGGNTQELVCPKLKNSIKKVWDNSDMYNDFVIQITPEISGTFTIKHSEYDNYKKYCQDNNIEFDEAKVLRKISITQVSADDTVGELVISIDGVEYTNKGTVDLHITKNEYTNINIVSTAYTKQLSPTQYTIINDKNVDLPAVPRWITISKEDNIIKLKASETNSFSTRTFVMKLVNHTNPHQFLNINVIQDSGK